MSILKVDNIQHTNGTSAISIATSGAVTNTNQPCWRLNGYNGATLVPGINNSTPHTFRQIDFSQGCTATTSRITLNTSGKYLVGVRFIVGNPSPNTETRYMSTYVKKNGSTYPARGMQGAEAIADGWGTGNSYHTFGLTDIIDCSANDYLEAVISRSSSSDWNGNIYDDNGSGHTVFFGYLVG